MGGAKDESDMTKTIQPGTLERTGRARILVIEDEAALARAFKRVIERLGFEVELAADGSEATARIMSSPFDTIVTDINMPGASGVDLLRTIRAYSLDVPVILVTGMPSLETAVEAVELGAHRYLVKPVDNDDLQRVVGRAVQLHRFAQLKREVLREIGQDGDKPSDLAGLGGRFASALEKLWIAFQPIVDLQTDRLYGYEALMRSREPSLPGPLDVLSAAERLDSVLELGTCIRAKIAEALQQLKDDRMHIFVNLHPEELLDTSLYDIAAPIMSFAPRLVLEVTERSTLAKLHDLTTRTSVLRFHGYRLAVDDLGAGYAGLTSFVTLEPEIVKLDMTLVRGIDMSAIRQQLVRSVVDLCSGLSMQIVGEGIETKEELRTLRDLGCHLGQGYFLGRPAAGFAGYGAS